MDEIIFASTIVCRKVKTMTFTIISVFYLDADYNQSND